MNKVIEKIVKESDHESFRLLYNDYSSKIYAFCRSYYISGEDAEEIVQEVFLKFWEKRKIFNLEVPVEGYLITTAKNLMLKKLRHQAVVKAYESNFLQSKPNSSLSLEDEIIFNDFYQIAKSIIDQLSPMRKEVFMKSRIDNLSNEEIAKQTGLSIRTIENHLYQAKKILLEKFKFFSLLIFLLLLHSF